VSTGAEEHGGYGSTTKGEQPILPEPGIGLPTLLYVFDGQQISAGAVTPDGTNAMSDGT